MFRKLSVLGFISLAVPAGAALYALGSLGSYTRYIADDYCSAAIAQNMSLIDAVKYWYTNWHGGFSATLMDELMPLLGKHGIAWTPPLTILIWWLFAVWATSNLLSHIQAFGVRTLATLSLATVGLYTIIRLNPDITQTLFWWTGLRGYITPVLFATLCIGCYLSLSHIDPQKVNRPAILAAAFLITLFAAGFSEIYTPVQVVFFGSALVIEWVFGNKRLQSPQFWALLGGMIGGITGLAVMLAAPGNVVRQLEFPPPPGVFAILSISVTGYLQFLGSFLGNPGNLIALGGGILTFALAGYMFPRSHRGSVWIVPICLLSGLIFSFGCFIPAAYGMSAPPPARAISIAEFFLVTFSFSMGYFGGQAWTKGQKQPVAWATISLLTLVLVGVSFSAYQTLQDVAAKKPEYIQFAQKWDKNDQRIIKYKEKGQPIAYIPPVKNWANLGYINEDPNYFVTQCASDYYGIPVRMNDNP